MLEVFRGRWEPNFEDGLLSLDLQKGERIFVEAVVGNRELIYKNGLWSWGHTPIKKKTTEEALRLLALFQKQIDTDFSLARDAKEAEDFIKGGNF